MRALSLLPILAFWTFQAAASAACHPAEILFVRHAEKEIAASSDDPPLSTTGQSRAQALAEKLATVRLDAVFTTPYQRTRSTADPVAIRHSLPVQIYDPKAPEALTQKLNIAHCQHHVLVVGHSNTVPDLLKRLGVTDTVVIADDRYGDLYRIHYEAEKPVLVRDHFGD